MLTARIARTLSLLAVSFGALSIAADAHAGIIVTVGRPSPEVFSQDNKKQQSEFDGHREGHRKEQYKDEGNRCVVLPSGEVACARSISVETTASVPKEWRCVAVDSRTLFCEVPGTGAAPDAAGYGIFEVEPTEEVYALDADEQIEALGCSGGAGASLGGLVIGLLVTMRRRKLS
jgi:hypothetical protein